MDPTVISSLISAAAIVASGLLTLVITGRQEKRRHEAELQERKAQDARRDSETRKSELFEIAELFFSEIDAADSFPPQYSWSEYFGFFLESRASKFDNKVRRAVALYAPQELREKLLLIIEALPATPHYADANWTDNYEQFLQMLRLGADLAADAARGVEDGPSAEGFRKFLSIRKWALEAIKSAEEEQRKKQNGE